MERLKISLGSNLEVLKVSWSFQETLMFSPNSQLMNALTNHYLTWLVANFSDDTKVSIYALHVRAEFVIYIFRGINNFNLTLFVFSFLLFSANSKVETKIATLNGKPSINLLFP